LKGDIVADIIVGWWKDCSG